MYNTRDVGRDVVKMFDHFDAILLTDDIPSAFIIWPPLVRFKAQRTTELSVLKSTNFLHRVYL